MNLLWLFNQWQWDRIAQRNKKEVTAIFKQAISDKAIFGFIRK